jgi:hypothetical protein
MAPRWTAAGMIEAAKGFRRLKAWKQLPSLAASLKAIQSKTSRLSGSRKQPNVKIHATCAQQTSTSSGIFLPGGQ